MSARKLTLALLALSGAVALGAWLLLLPAKSDRKGPESPLTTSSPSTEQPGTNNSKPPAPLSQRTKSTPSLPEIADVTLIPLDERQPGESPLKHKIRKRLTASFLDWADRHDLSEDDRRRTLVIISDTTAEWNATVKEATKWVPPESGEELSPEEIKDTIHWKKFHESMTARLGQYLSDEEIKDFNETLRFGDLLIVPMVATR